MTVIEAINELDDKFSKLDSGASLTVEQGRELLLCCKRLALWNRSLSGLIDIVDVDLARVEQDLERYR